MSILSRRMFVATTGAALATGAWVRPAGAKHAGNGAGVRPGAQPVSWVPTDALIDRLPEILRLARCPAVSIAVVEDGRLVFEHAVGVKNAESGEPVDTNTVFEAASLSKPTVAYVAMLLSDEGRLDLDRPLVDYVEPDHLLDDPRARRITARHVMSQSSGLRNWRRPTDTEFALSFDPGTQYQYSGEGFVWLARVLERITDTGFVRLMRDRLFDPLGLQATTFLWNPSLEGRMATGHDQRGEPTRNGLHIPMARSHRERADAIGRPVEDWKWEDLVAAAREARPDRTPMPGGLVPNAAASLLTTAAEYARFVALLLDGPPVSPALREESRRLMHTARTEVEPPIAWGLGVALEDHGGAPHVWHWGNNGDFHSYFIGDVHGRKAVAVFTNAAGGPKVYERVARDSAGFDPASLIWI